MNPIRRIKNEMPFLGSCRNAVWRTYDLALARLPNLPLPWRGYKKKISIPADGNQFWLRIGTSDFSVLAGLFLHGEYDETIRRIGRTPETVLDLGANVGYSIRLWANAFPGCKICACEPDPANASLCRENIDLGHIDLTVSLYEVAAAAADGKAFLDPARSTDSFTTSPQDTPGTIGIPARSVDRILRDAGMPENIDFMKCDIEGGEQALFHECADWINRVEFMVVEVHGNYRPDDLLADIAANGGRHQIVASHDKGFSMSLVCLRRIDTRR